MEKQAGLYVAVDVTAAKAYVGSTTDKDLRFRNHERELKNGKHNNFHLQRAYNAGHELQVLFIPTQPGVDVLQCEQAILDDFYDTGVLYNIARDALAPMKGLSHSPEAREKIRQANLGKGNHRGHTHSNEAKAAISAKAIERLSDPEVIRQKQYANTSVMKEVLINRTTYPSIADAARTLGLDRNRVRLRIKNDSPKFQNWQSV